MTETTMTAPSTEHTRVAPHADRLLAGLLIGPLLVTLGKLAPMPTAELFSEFFSVEHVSESARHLVIGLFFVPTGALVVVAFRRVLGFKVLGFFRPILIAVAFASIGVLLGTACLLVFLALIAAVRPSLAGTPYNARIPLLLSLVAAMLAMLLMVGGWWHVDWLEKAAYFPVIALCLSCESFARVLERDGLGEASWRTIGTVLAAIAITAITGWPGFIRFMLRMPELLFVEAGVVLLVARYLSFRVFEGWNPLRSGKFTTAASRDDEAVDRSRCDD